MKTLFLAAALAFSTTFLSPAFAQVTSAGDAINKAGRERMLVPRMAKAYMQVGMDVDAQKSRALLQGSAAVFDRTLVELKVYAPTPTIRDAYVKLEGRWGAYKDLLMGSKPSPANAVKVAELCGEVLDLADRAELLLEQHIGKQSAKIVDVAGKQRARSQRLAMIFQAEAWGVKIANAKSELDKAHDEFLAVMKSLEKAPETTQDIRGELLLASSQWVFFENALIAKNIDLKQRAANVAKSSERVLEVLNKVTDMYASNVK